MDNAEPVRSGAGHQKLFFNFLNEYQEWSETGKEPETADREFRYALDLQKKRLRRHNVAERIVFDEFDGEPTQVGTLFPNGRQRKGLHCVSGRESREFLKAGTSERIGRRKRFVFAYETIVDRPSNTADASENLYNCPNCGGVSRVKDLLDGCPYCNTRFVMGNLYPKVNGFYTVESPPDKKHLLKGLFVSMAVSGIVLAVLSALVNLKNLRSGDMSAAGYIVAVLAAMLVGGALIGYFVYAIGNLGKVFYKAGKSVPVLTGSSGAKKKIDEMVSAVDPDLGYEYFEGKALSLIRTICFADDTANLAQYSGGELSERTRRLVDADYRGAIGVKSIRRVKTPAGEEKIRAEITAYMENFYYEREKVRPRNEVVSMTMEHHAARRINTAFSITKVACPHCGGSFDATKERKCVYCGKPYDAGLEDWIVTALTID